MQPNTESAVQLARMYEDYQQSLKWLVKEGRSEYEVLQQAAYWYQVAAQEVCVATMRVVFNPIRIAKRRVWGCVGCLIMQLGGCASIREVGADVHRLARRRY